MQTSILIVEDEPILYERLRRFLIKENFNVFEYTKSYNEAIENIVQNTPDLVLLDINLQGEKDGIDLGEELYNTYKIPFIYVTDFADDVTFNRALRTNPNIFEVKTKPQIDTKHLLRSIKTVLQQTKEKIIPPKEGIMVYIDYLDKLKNLGKNVVTKVPISFTDVDYITTEALIINKKEIASVRKNYVRIETLDNHYFYKTSLKNILNILPNTFIRINESTIINLKSPNFNGRINGSRLSIKKQHFCIKETYAKNVNNTIELLYKS